MSVQQFSWFTGFACAILIFLPLFLWQHTRRGRLQQKGLELYGESKVHVLKKKQLGEENIAKREGACILYETNLILRCEHTSN